MTSKIGRVNIPVFAVIAAIPPAIRRAHDVIVAAKGDASAGGSKVTAGEVMQSIEAFVAELVREVGPVILTANGID
jgi:hypothetical protein